MSDKINIAFCGLNCGACFKFKKGKCPGCAKNEKATWCKNRTCCLNKGIKSCADCTDFPVAGDCKKFNTVIGRVIGFFFNSDRQACLKRIKEVGYEQFSAEMQEKNWVSLPRRKK